MGGGDFWPRISTSLVALILLSWFPLNAQTTGPIPPQCGMTGDSIGNPPSGELSVACGITSDLFSSHTRHLPDTGAQAIRIRADFIILQRADGSGNFQNNTDDVAFLNDWFDKCNERLPNLWGSSTCSPLFRNAKVQIVPNWIFLPDTSQGEYRWNNDNDPATRNQRRVDKYPGRRRGFEKQRYDRRRHCRRYNALFSGLGHS